MGSFRVIALILSLTAGLTLRAQLYQSEYHCDSTQEYGPGFTIEAGKLFPQQNINVQYNFRFKAGNDHPQALLVFEVKDGTNCTYWQGYPLEGFVNDTAEWSTVSIHQNFPLDYIGKGNINTYIWNRNRENLWFEEARLDYKAWNMPSYLGTENRERRTENGAWGMLTEYILDGDTITEYHPFVKQESETPRDNDSYMAVSNIDTAKMVVSGQKNIIHLSNWFYRDCELLRLTMVVPFDDSTLTVYRRNMAIDTVDFQPEYYLDREGFKIGEGEHTIISYHQRGISSTQLDAKNKVVYFNLDYWRDHPMIHYPMSDTLEDRFEDRSCRHVYEGQGLLYFIKLYVGNDVPNLPRIMKIPYGYESGIIFTEHADWTDIRTHRAVLFGSENITKAKDAVGGFVYYGIPVTKSVFYNNPDQVTNDEISGGTFTGLHATIKTDKEFGKLLRQLHRIGFDICLHTPEQYTTTKENLEEAMDYMQRHFKSTTWIDHGYNNGPIHNREDMVCDGLDQNSDAYAVTQWRKHRVKYLWNAYYEENRMDSWGFDCNLMQPYPGFGDALPNRQVTTIAGFDYFHGSFGHADLMNPPDFLTWCTPSTFEATTDEEWDYYYNNERLQKLVDNHDVHITHIYPAWIKPGRTFWTYDEDSTIVALPGMNRALERIANLREEHKMLPMTIKTYLDYYSGLLQVEYYIIDSEHILLYNCGKEIKGFTLLCTSPIRFEDNRYYEFRKSGDYYYIWFDLKAYDQVRIKIVNN